MITLEVGKAEYFDDSTSQFVYDEGTSIRFEYSLKVLYNWEHKWKKPFLKGELTEEELLDFYKLMAIDPIEERHLTTDVQQQLVDYIKDENTATIFTTPKETGTNGGSSKSKIYTSEELYALMFTAGIPLEFENRNLNRLFVILRIIGNYNNPPKKMSKQDILRQNSELNAQRRAAMKTKG